MPLAELATCSETNVAVGMPSTFRQAESSVIIDALSAASGRIAGKAGAAERLGLKRTTLQKQNSPPRHHESSISELAN